MVILAASAYIAIGALLVYFGLHKELLMQKRNMMYREMDLNWELRPMAIVLFGLLWPVAAPFYVVWLQAIEEADRQEQERLKRED